MSLGDDLKELVKQCDDFAKQDLGKACKNMANAGVYLVTDLRRKRAYPLHWLLHVRGEGKKFSDSRNSNASIRKYAQALQEAGFEEIHHDDNGFDLVWDAVKRSCERLGGEPSNRKNAPNYTNRRFFALFAELEDLQSEMKLPDADDHIRKGKEGATIQATSNKYERDQNLRAACAKHYFSQDGRLACQVCDMDFQSRYGDIGRGFIHIHHLNPLGDGQGERKVDPIKDLVPVCPNCHAMLHKKPGKENVYTLDELKKMLKGKV